jgi:hypothetical protein
MKQAATVLPDNLYNEIKKRAQEGFRTISQQISLLLTKALLEEGCDKDYLLNKKDIDTEIRDGQ